MRWLQRRRERRSKARAKFTLNVDTAPKVSSVKKGRKSITPRNRRLTAKRLEAAGLRPRMPRKPRRGTLVPRCLAEVARRRLTPSLVTKSADTACPRPKQHALNWCHILVPRRPPEA